MKHSSSYIENNGVRPVAQTNHITSPFLNNKIAMSP